MPARVLPHWSVDTQTVVILDFGSQYTQLIARRIREQNVFSVVLPCTAPLAEIQALKPIGLILSGGPSSVYDIDAPDADPQVLELGVPALGVCYGLHFIVHHLGGKVRSAPKREYGHAEVTIEDAATPLFAGLPADDPGVDEPRRRSARAAARAFAASPSPQRAGRNRQRGAPHLGRAIPSRGAPHAAGTAAHPELFFASAERAATGRRRISSRARWQRSARK